MINAKPLFDAIRRIKGSVLLQDEVDEINRLIGANEPSIRQLGAKGFALIKSFEGLRLKAYPDPGTGAEPWSIGYGHTGGVKPGDVITEAVADTFLMEDIKRFERAVNHLCPVTTQNQFDAMVSLSFNIGDKAFEDSTLRRLHNEGKYGEARMQFARWNKSGGKEMAGLSRRRAAEGLLYGTA